MMNSKDHCCFLDLKELLRNREISWEDFCKYGDTLKGFDTGLEKKEVYEFVNNQSDFVKYFNITY